MDGGSFIRELCIAVEHRWDPEKFFVLFTAYFDEADTHGASPRMAMGAILGHARQWVLFNRELNRLRKAEGFHIFHATKFKASKGEFENWDDPKSMNVAFRLTDMIKDNLTEGVLHNLPYDRYITEYRQSPTPKGIDLDSQYGLCFRALIAHIIEILTRDGKKHRLHVIVENGHPSAKNTGKIFFELKDTLKARGIDLLGEWSLAGKEDKPELMAADYLVHSYAMMIRPGGTGIKGYAEATAEPPKGEAGLTFLEFLPDAFEKIKLEMRYQRFERQAYKRRLKAEAKATALTSPKERP